MSPSVQHVDQTEYRNADNIVNYYKIELRSLRKGKKIVKSIPSGTRKRLVEYGVIRRFGSKFELTDQGDLLLRRI